MLITGHGYGQMDSLFLIQIGLKVLLNIFKQIICSGNPNNHTRDNCLALNPSNGLWHSQNCYKTIPYICELSQTNCQNTSCPPCPQTTCSPCQSHCEMPCPDSWVYNSKTGFCYKVKKFSLNITSRKKCTFSMLLPMKNWFF